MMATSRFRLAVGTTIVGNAIPLVGVVTYGIDLHALLVVYWIEAGVIGAVTTAKIRHANGTDDVERLPNWEYSPFGSGESRTVRSLVGRPNAAIRNEFLATYVGMWLILGLFVIALPGEYATLDAGSPGVVVGAAVSISAYHVLSYRVHYLGDEEYERKGPVTLLVEPFPHVFVLLITFVCSGIAITLVGSPVGLLVVLVAAKTYYDIRAHRREHSDMTIGEASEERQLSA